jgi:uncharacterized protein YoxC
MITTSALITLGKIATALVALYVFYIKVLKKWIKAGYAKLMEDLTNQVTQINHKVDAFGTYKNGEEN